MNIDMQMVSGFLQVILMAILPVLVSALVNWAVKAARSEASKMDQQQLSALLWVVDIAVKAAEQAKLSGFITDKKQYAIEYIQAWLDSRGIHVTVAEIDVMIEAAVMEQFNRDKQPAVPSMPTEPVAVG